MPVVAEEFREPCPGHDLVWHKWNEGSDDIHPPRPTVFEDHVEGDLYGGACRNMTEHEEALILPIAGKLPPVEHSVHDVGLGEALTGSVPYSVTAQPVPPNSDERPQITEVPDPRPSSTLGGKTPKSTVPP